MTPRDRTPSRSCYPRYLAHRGTYKRYHHDAEPSLVFAPCIQAAFAVKHGKPTYNFLNADKAKLMLVVFAMGSSALICTKGVWMHFDPCVAGGHWGDYASRVVRFQKPRENYLLGRESVIR